MIATQRIEQIRIKIDRAKEHAEALDKEIGAYYASNPYAIDMKRDPLSQRPIYFVCDIRPTPLKLSAILGDTIHNLRCALDHLAYQLVWLGTGAVSMKHIYFPIAKNATTYNDQRKTQLAGARVRAIAEIDALKPYQGGNDLLWRIHQLDIVDKHRTLITAGSALRGINVGAYMGRNLKKEFPHLSGTPSVDAFLRPGDRLFPLKVGDELFVDRPNAPLDEELQFRLELAFAETGVVEGEPILEAIQPMITHVDEIIARVEPLLV